jgi:SH3 domain-containing protein
MFNEQTQIIQSLYPLQPLSQRDPRWKDVPLGFGDNRTAIGSDGCLLTCVAMVANGFGFQETPATLNDKLKALGPGAGFSGALLVFSGVGQALPGLLLKNVVRCRDAAAPMTDIDAALDAGKPVIVELDQSPLPGFQNHWVVLYARQGGDYLILDPWPVPAMAGVSLLQRYGFAGLPARIITTAVFYDNPNAMPPLPPAVIVNDEPDIHMAGGLALRVAPWTGTVITRLPVGVPLQLAELAMPGLAKVGQPGQWLRVVTADGTQGYVAAWYVHAVRRPALLAAA